MRSSLERRVRVLETVAPRGDPHVIVVQFVSAAELDAPVRRSTLKGMDQRLSADESEAEFVARLQRVAAEGAEPGSVQILFLHSAEQPAT